MSKWRPAWTLTPEMIPFWTKSVTLSMLIDLLTSTMSCRSTQVMIASTDLWPQEMFTFSEMLALVESESSFGAYVCHRRPGGSQRLVILWVLKLLQNNIHCFKKRICLSSKRRRWASNGLRVRNKMFCPNVCSIYVRNPKVEWGRRRGRGLLNWFSVQCCTESWPFLKLTMFFLASRELIWITESWKSPKVGTIAHEYLVSKMMLGIFDIRSFSYFHRILPKKK